MEPMDPPLDPPLHCCHIPILLLLTGKKPLEMIKEPLSRESIAPEEELARLLMYNPCKSDHEVIVWKTPPQYDQ